MPFEKDDSRINRNGRPPERFVTNKELKMLFKNMLFDNTNHLIENINELSTRDRIQLQKILATHVLPRLNSVSIYGDDFPQFQQIEINDTNSKS